MTTTIERCRYCNDPIEWHEQGGWVDENGLRSCAPLAPQHVPREDVVGYSRDPAIRLRRVLERIRTKENELRDLYVVRDELQSRKD